MENLLRIDGFEFERTYRPVLDANGRWRDFLWKDDRECMAALAEAAPAGRVWTLVDADGFTLVMSGRHYVNRLEYYITDVAVPGGVTVEVYDPDELEEWMERESAQAEG